MRFFYTTRTCIILIVLMLLMACEKAVDIIPSTLDQVVVVEGSIENNQPPVVVLTRSLAFFEQLSAQDFANSFVRNANVFVSDGTRRVRLTEYRRQVGNANFYFYSIDSTNPAQLMIGRLNTSYKLEIEAEGNVYSANTSIPDISRKVDSLWWQKAPGNGDSSFAVVFSRVTDPKGFGNYIRYFTSVNDSAFLPGSNSVFDDKFVDGTTYDIQVFRGFNRNVEFDPETFGFFKRGERVRVKMSNIDKATYDFWRTWEQNQSNVGNPFGVPVKVLSNLSAGATGIFAGYASQITSIIIPQ
ncbi:MAG: DUF4249 domain-containing protein [Chitinophagaceae bacterium]|nr:DUF4249 domain-containing protein [Chitinophagaceae bacterium]